MYFVLKAVGNSINIIYVAVETPLENSCLLERIGELKSRSVL